MNPYALCHGITRSKYADTQSKTLHFLKRHGQNSTELGYLISTGDLNEQYYYARNTSVRALASRTGMDGRTLTTGADSLGAYFEEEGCKAVPSPRQPYPGQNVRDRYRLKAKAHVMFVFTSTCSTCTYIGIWIYIRIYSLDFSQLVYIYVRNTRFHGIVVFLL